MNTSQFMDKQIMDLSSSSSPNNNANYSKDFINLMNDTPPEEDHYESKSSEMGGGDNGIKKEEIYPCYDFQPIRPISAPADSTATANIGGGGRAATNPRVWSSADSKTKAFGCLDSLEHTEVILERDQNVSGPAILSDIDRTMKKYTDNLMHVLEGVSARLTQLETRTRQLENSVDDLHVSVGNNHGATDGKMRQIEIILREVQTGVQVVRDKQEIMEAQLQVVKLHVPKADEPSESPNAVQQAASAPIQSPASASAPLHQQLPPGSFPQSHPPTSSVPRQSVPMPVQNSSQFPQSQVPSVPQRDPYSGSFPQTQPPLPSPPTASQQNLPLPVQPPNQFPQNQVPVSQRDTYFSPPSQTQEPPKQQYQVPPALQPLPPLPALPDQPYQPTPQPQYTQPPQLPQIQPPVAQHMEETTYVPSQNYPPNVRQPPAQPPSSVPSQHYHGAPPHMYEPPGVRSSSGFSAGYIPQSGPGEQYPYGGSPSQYNSGSAMKMQQPPSAMAPGGASGYPQLPAARVLPHALPTASGVGGGSDSPRSGTENKVPIDDVVDKVTSMGFPRDHVRAIIRRLTENGQAVDLNIVLDKLMNDSEMQRQRGWFGR